MIKSVLTLVDFCSRLSLCVFPYKIEKRLLSLRNYILSKRFCYLSNNPNGNIHMEWPFYIMGHKYIKCSSFSARAGLRLECLSKYEGKATFRPNLIIGENVSFNFRCHVAVINKVVIGNNVLIGSNVLITDHSHGFGNNKDILIPPVKRDLYSKGPVVIGDNVWIGDNVCVLSGVTIGKNSIVGANTVVTRNIPANSVVAGNPLRIIRTIREKG